MELALPYDGVKLRDSRARASALGDHRADQLARLARLQATLRACLEPAEYAQMAHTYGWELAD